MDQLSAEQVTLIIRDSNQVLLIGTGFAVCPGNRSGFRVRHTECREITAGHANSGCAKGKISLQMLGNTTRNHQGKKWHKYRRLKRTCA